jgi:hypothetical protein
MRVPPRPPASVDPVPVDPASTGGAAPLAARPERSEPVHAISMKDQIAASAQASRPAPPRRVPLHVQLCNLAEVASSHSEPQHDLGYLAPPRDPDRKPARRPRDYVVWTCAALLVVGGIAMAIWLLAG